MGEIAEQVATLVCRNFKSPQIPMKNNHALVAVAAALFSAAFVFAGETGKSVVLPKANLKWTAMGNAGVAAAPVSGDMQKGPCRFYLKYPAGLVTPMHHHSSDHYVTMISGSITLTVGGKEHRLGPGDYFMLADRAMHTAKVEGKEDAVFFIQADGPWDVVMK
jgi:mannose-6-phosphate isomerase-like protein (cupin superfamily)